MVVGAAAADGAAGCRAGADIDSIVVEGELRHEGSGLSHRESVGGVGRYLGAVLGPTDEVISRGRGGDQGAGAAFLDASRAADRTARGRAGRSGDVVVGNGRGVFFAKLNLVLHVDPGAAITGRTGRVVVSIVTVDIDGLVVGVEHPARHVG